MVGTLARVFGVVFVVVGLLGFVPQATPNGALLGIFPVNALHNIVHIGLGVWGLAVGGTAAGAGTYMRGLTIIYALLAVLGLIPATNDLFGLVPLHGPDVALHAVLAAAAAYLGFGPPSKATAPSA